MNKQRAYINATIINGDKSKDVMQNGTILVDKIGNISAIGTDVDIPNGCPTVDLSGKYIMPGLVNGHLHYFLTGAPRRDMVGSKAKNLMKFVKTRLGKKLVTRIYKKNVQTSVHSGVTTARDVGSIYYNDLKMRDLINAGKIDGPRIVCCGTLIAPTGGHGCSIPGTCIADGPLECIKAVREHYHHQVDGIKICNTGGVSDAKYVGEAGAPHMTVEEIEAVCKEAHKRGYLVASHCESTQGMRDALAGGVDTIEHGSDIEDDMVNLFFNNPKTLRGYTSLIPTIAAGSALYEHRDYLLQDEAHKIVIENSKLIMEGCIKGLQKAVKYGIKVGIGTDASVPFVTQYNTWMELCYFKEHTDLTNEDVIEIATKDTAEIIGVGDITGTLDVGKSADFIVLEKSPLDDLKNIKKPLHVIANGKFIEKPEYKEIEGV